MDTNYNRKFEEMKEYIPFLESMIKRLENPSTESNPRQAQLDKIRSLRDLLLDKKKRMKLNNLLKCEQVLINLYAKVQQRDPWPKDEALDKKATEMSDLNLVRKKLKSAVSKLQSAEEETLPEIARASVTEEVCVPGSKEPALFQRRPNMPSTVSSPFSPTRNKESKRNYTRVLQSPETSHKRWTNTEKISDKPLFCRRSPKKSTRVSPTYYKKEHSKSKNKKDLNITLKVPEESLNSLNTKDILSRIINCNDNDVDIDTLRELRTQILGELKDTGVKDDISDIILKSYKKTDKKSVKNKEIEEGELSDSESEAIENIYGSLVIMDKEESASEKIVKASETEKPRKIQICLVINTDKNKSISQEENCKSVDISEFETYAKKENNSKQTELVPETKEVTEQTPINCNIVKNANFKADLEKNDKNINILPAEGQVEISNVEQEKENIIQFPLKKDVDASKETNKFSEKNHKPNLCTSTQDHNEENNKDTSKNKKDTSPDFDNQNEKSNTKRISTSNTSTEKNTTAINDGLDKSKQKSNPENSTSCDKEQKPNDDIPLLEPTENVSEIDILQALKKEILNETISVLETESITPPLHQPKITKVVNAQEIGTKKRISIESYKAKSNTSTKSNTSNDNTSNVAKDDVTRKQSLKLTEKECERFNLSKLSYAESSEDEDLSNVTMDNLYCNLAPKSPDHEDFADTGLKPPIIIPSDPVKTTVVSSEADIDMRKLVPNLQMNCLISNTSISPSYCKDDLLKVLSTEKEVIKGDKPLLDPRIKRETSCVPENSNPYLINTNNMQKRSGITYTSSTLNLNKFQNINGTSPSLSNPNATPTRVSMVSPNLPTNIPQLMPNLTPNMTPIRSTNMASSMTPNARKYDLTPSRQAFENGDFSSRKHVYTPIFQTSESRDYNENQRHQWEKHDKNQPFWEDVDMRGSSVQRDIDYRDPRSNSIQRDNKTFEQYQMGSRNDRFIKDSTPSHSFVRLECPATPNASFGRLDSPSTPTPSFGRMECPSTPTPSFGRIDCPMTPIPSFGRSECPPTPNHPFGRSEPFHGTPFIRPDFSQSVTNQNYGKPQVPRLTRGSESDKYYARDDDRGRNYFQDRNINKDISYKSEQSNCYSSSDHYRKFQREQSASRNERNKNYEQNVRNFKESNRSFNRDFESERTNSKNRGSSARNYENRLQNEFKKYDDCERRNFQRERSFGRKESTRERFSRSRNRDTFYKENNVSSNCHVDSFTIDTSVDRTFQSTDKILSSSFDARRQRAASVGRTLINDCRKDNNTRNTIIKSTKKEQNSTIRRACSVGREIKNSKLDFKDIKEDLRSFKLKENKMFSIGHEKTVDSHKVTEFKKTCESRSRKEIYDNSKSIQNNIKYSPKKNNRDPRMRRENYERKEKHRDDNRTYSNDRKKYGIVYSHDNISKGNILGPGYGVKNYKIPKIKRAQEEKDASPCSDGQSKNIKYNKIVNNSVKTVEDKDSSLKSKNKKINSSQKNNQPNTVQEEKNNISSSNTEEILKITVSESTISKVIDTNDEVEKNNKKDKQDLKIFESSVEVEAQNLKTLEENKTNINAEILLEISDKRMTRSVSRNIHDKDLEQFDTSPLKRTRRIKKPLVYESDSEDNDIEHANSLTSDLNTKIQELTSDNVNVNAQPQVLDNVENESETQKKSVISHQGNEDNEQNDSLDNSFGIDDLEFFSENVVSDPVIDNINALIADLDHDLDSAKSVDNSNFTKELSLETMLENITSPEECNNMENSEEIDDPKTKILNPVKDTLSTSCDKADHENAKKIIEVASAVPPGLVDKVKSTIDSENKKEDNEHLTIENKRASEMKPPERVLTESDNTVNGIDVEDTRSNEAIVSTSGDDNSHEKNVLDEVGVPVVSSQSTPDSTINCSEINEDVDSQKSVPDSTNDSQCEMNSDITSTNNTAETLNMELSESSSSHTASAEIETFGKLLSILQDKSKIKELIGLLGDSSSENEKIKKKLEKLNEIPSDDEDTMSENNSAKINGVINNSNSIEDNQKDQPICDETKKDDQSNTNTFQSEIINKEYITDDSDSVQKDQEKIKSMSENTLLKQSDSNEIVVNKNSQVDIDANERNTTNTTNPKDELVNLTEDSKNPKQEDDRNTPEIITADSPKNAACNDHDDAKKSNTIDTEILEPKEMATGGGKTKNKNYKFNNAKQQKRKTTTKSVPTKEKRLTRSDVANLRYEKSARKKPTELQKLQDDIREMFLNEKDDILSTGVTGIRMCRLAKLVDETRNQNDEQTEAGSISSQSSNQEPVVVLEKFKNFKSSEEISHIDTSKKKCKMKGKRTPLESDSSFDTEDKFIKKGKPNKLSTNIKINFKAKAKMKENVEVIDPYTFDTEVTNHLENTSNLENDIKSSESESESAVSLKSFGSMELLTEAKKKIKRKRVSKGWQAGIIKPKNRKKKVGGKNILKTSSCEVIESQSVTQAPVDCFTDKTYCFLKRQSCYDCRLCSYRGTEIVKHYKKQHPHSEIPLSRMSSAVAKEAIEESKNLNFPVICKVSSKKYVCRFCFEEFASKKVSLEAFFWHIVSAHTGEYNQLCSECPNVTRCPFNQDIPQTPKKTNGQLLGYLCEKCYYTQLSLENLKSHVILRHNDENTGIHAINLSVMTKDCLNIFLEKSRKKDISNLESRSRLLRSSQSNQSCAESSDVKSDTTEESYRNTNGKDGTNGIENENEDQSVKVPKPCSIQSKITFENDNTDEISNFDDTSDIKIKQEVNECQDIPHINNDLQIDKHNQETSSKNQVKEEKASNDIFDYPHFKIKYTDTGSKEYVCCIKGNFHYKTPLLISLKKHVQLKHSEVWDGFCFMCKVIVTPQGVYHFKDCLQHFLDKHDNFPIFEEVILEPNTQKNESDNVCNENLTALTSYINVRPLSELQSQTLPISQSTAANSTALPIIESVVSLGSEIQQSSPSPSYPSREQTIIKKQYKYEEVQAETMSKKHRAVLDAMMSNIKLVHVFKCAGRFCSFTTDSANDALAHASTHLRVGGVDSLNCVYCDYDASNNDVELVTHVFNIHGRCPYVCNLCFYRATTVQLVDAHIKRVHENETNYQILHTSFNTGTNTEDQILSREAAVQFYVCTVGRGTAAACKYKTYTPGRYSDHFSSKHDSETEFSCFICPMKLSTASDLVAHMKIHGLHLYQCTWCVYGSDSEAGLLAHSSSNHPDKIPKAYLRIITNKEGTNEYRVLPLAHLNKTEIASIEVAPQNYKENPVRVAERSTELEKLISQTALMIESTSNVEVNEPNSNIKHELQSSVQEDLSPEKSAEITPTSLSEQKNKSEIISTPVIKSEKQESAADNASQILPEVVCLDSDEESASQNVIDLSDDASTSSVQNSMTLNDSTIETKILPLTELFLCAKCNMTFKGGPGFKKHITACYSSISDPIPCAHCSLFTKKKDIVTHYTRMHLQRPESKTYPCPKCPRKLNSLAQLREHEKIEHSVISVSQPNTDTHVKKPIGPKGRKRSLGSKEKVVEPPEKIKKYEPHEIHLLPINPILDDSVFCSLCEFSTKVRHNMVRHLQLHAEQQPVPQTAPVNPVPHLETNEKHFDKMVNLASSSIVPRTDKSKADYTPANVMIPPEATSRYPKHVPEKHRLTCGAKGCSYISVDESMLKRHWEALHNGTNLFHCVHCPPYQHLDTTKPLTASRVIAHLKMHDSNLYACSLCAYYHYRRQLLENHLNDVHKGGQVMIVREENSTVPTSPVQTSAVAPTMDLKPWQCGLCKYKSLLRPEVVEHCAKTHNSKMQYKCAYCAFRTSNSENITKHQSKSHVGKQEEIFYYYYQEGSVPDDRDGVPRWQKQSQKFFVETNSSSDGVSGFTSVKSENPSPGESLMLPIISQTVSLPQTEAPANQEIDLNLVKKEAMEATPETIEKLCKEFGEFCEPNGLKYKCPLCKHVIEDTVEAMQSHLYEELKYRKWGCSICSYKAFHKTGLNEHMQIEHRQNREPVSLQADVRVETWVTQLLEHQTAFILKNKENLAKQKEEIFRPVPGTSTKPPVVTNSPATASVSKKLSMTELEKTFGSFGAPVNMSFCCPKCKVLFKEESAMENHLETELNKMRWFCSDCFVTFQTYHEAQFHCRSAHMGTYHRPVEVIRDPVVRLSWVEAVIRVQKLSMNYVPLQKNITPETETLESNEPENSLLVVRYEETVSTPERQMTAVSTSITAPDSDDEKLIIDEPKKPQKFPKNCHICTRFYSANARVMRDHILRHYNLKPLICGHCNLMITRRSLDNHQRTHPYLPPLYFDVQIPLESPGDYLAKQRLKMNNKMNKVICLDCQNSFGDAEAKKHKHNNVAAVFGKKGDIVTKCAFCLTLHKDVNAYNEHHESTHEFKPKNYVFTKLKTIQNESKLMLYACGNCTQKFVCMSELKTHVASSHNGRLSYTIVPKHKPQGEVIDLDPEEGTTNKRKADVDPLLPKNKVAKKSTTKLPLTKACARKSTTKLPREVPNEIEEFSYYGTRPENTGLDQVTAMMPFCNSVVPLSLEKLNEIVNINPTVRVKKND